MELRNLEWLAATDVGAGKFVVAAHHVRLGFGKAGPVPFVRVTGQLRPFPPYDPAHLVLARLPALGAGKRVLPHFSCFVEKLAFFHVIRPSDAPLQRQNSIAGRRRFQFPEKVLAGAFASLQSIPYSSLA